MYDYDDDRYDDHDDGFADFLATLAENGEGYCEHHGERFDLPEGEDEGECPSCVRTREVQELVELGEVEPDAICFACGGAVSETTFMGQRVCWSCYRAIAEGNHRPDRCHFADRGGRSALRAAGPGNPRVHPCPNCREPNRLTPQDVARGYQCDSCADRAEGRMGGWDY